MTQQWMNGWTVDRDIVSSVDEIPYVTIHYHTIRYM